MVIPWLAPVVIKRFVYGVSVRGRCSLFFPSPKATAACGRWPFIPMGRILAAGNETGLLQLWDTERGVLLREVQAHRYMLWFLAFSPDGTLLATGSNDKTIQLWSVARLLSANRPVVGNSLTPQRILTGHTGRVNWLCFSPDGRWLASSSNDQTVHLWNVAVTGITVAQKTALKALGALELEIGD